MTAYKHITDLAAGRDNVRVRVYDVAVLRWIEPCYDALPPRAQLQVMRDAADALVHETTSHNTVCVELDELRADDLDQTTVTDPDTADEIAVGDDSTAPAYSNRSLNNEVERVDIAEYEQDGTTLILNASLGTEQANDATNEIAEIGAVSEQGRLLNHALINSFEKTNNRSATLEIQLQFDNS